ncbi:MAG: M24 family metallopeptidase [Pseudomonadota bacterium]
MIPKRPASFSEEEYAARLAATQTALAEAELDAVICADPSNMAWLTGYDGWSFYVHQAVIVRRNGPPLWWGRPMDANGAKVTVWMSDEHIFSYPDNYVMNPDRHPYSHLSAHLKDWGLESGRIGVELDNYYFSAACYTTLRAELPQAEIVNATGLVNWRRLIKSPAEIDMIRKAAKIVTATHARIVEIAEPGLRKCDLVAEIYASLIRGTTEYGGDYAAIAPMTPSGPEATAAHLTWDETPMKTGEATFFEIAGCYRRYHCPQSRTLCLGEPAAALLKIEDVALEGIDAVLSAAKPGATCHDLATVFQGVLRKHGVEKESRIGYSVGLSYPPDWGERTISIRPGDMTELRENMVLHLIPAMWMEDFGLEITETFLVTAAGAECLCDTPRRLYVKS